MKKCSCDSFADTNTHTQTHASTQKRPRLLFLLFMDTDEKPKGHGNAHRCWLAGDYIDDVIKIHFVS